MPTLRDVLNSALQHYNAGRLDHAQAIYDQILSQQPNEPNALHMLGLIALRHKQAELAVNYLEKVVALHPHFTEARSNLGAALHAAGRLPEAAACFEALIATAPNVAHAHFNLARVYKDQNDFPKAEAAYLRALTLQPDFPEALSNLCAVYRRLNRPDEAMAAIHKAAALRPQNPDYQYAIGCVHRDLHQFTEAEAAFRKTINMNPQHAEAHRDLGYMLILAGNFLDGWREHEYRFQCHDVQNPYPNPIQPRWDGSPLNGRSIFLITEQGLGDSIQYIRYAPLIAQGGGIIHLVCPQPLRRLFAQIPTIYATHLAADAIPPTDVYATTMSLPFIFQTTLDTIPAHVPYLAPVPADVQAWQQKIAPFAGKRKVGLTWAGNPNYSNDHHRSLDPALLTPLGNAENTIFFNLQKFPSTAAAVPQPLPPFPLIDFTADLHDFADTAALIQNLDLIITVDTAVAHLAGALAKPVWILLPHVPDSRWLLNRTDSPWYATARLFRQPAGNDWQSAIAEIAALLQTF